MAEAVLKLGTDDWVMVASLLQENYGIKSRSGKKCRERWINHVRPEVSISKWTTEEELTVIRSQAFYGNQWTEIAKFLPGRTDNSVKNYFYSLLRRRIRVYNKGKASEDKIKVSANEVSMNKELTKAVLDSCESRKNKYADLMPRSGKRRSEKFKQKDEEEDRNEEEEEKSGEAVGTDGKNCQGFEWEQFESFSTMLSSDIFFDFTRY